MLYRCNTKKETCACVFPDVPRYHTFDEVYGYPITARSINDPNPCDSVTQVTTIGTLAQRGAGNSAFRQLWRYHGSGDEERTPNQATHQGFVSCDFFPEEGGLKMMKGGLFFCMTTVEVEAQPTVAMAVCKTCHIDFWDNSTTNPTQIFQEWYQRSE